jgi:hypothetical protein
MKRTLIRIAKFPRLLYRRMHEQGLRTTYLWVSEHMIRMATGAPRLSTSRVMPGLIVGGQYRRRGWPRLEKAGVTGVLSLREEFCDREAGIAPAHYLRISTPDDEAPSMDQLAAGVAFIQSELDHGGCVYVHCGAGVGRAATMAAAYMIAQGMSHDASWSAIRKVRPFIRPTPPQLTAIEEWASLNR